MLKKCLKVLKSVEHTIAFHNGLYATDLEEKKSDEHFQLDTTEDLKDLQEMQKLISNSCTF